MNTSHHSKFAIPGIFYLAAAVIILAAMQVSSGIVTQFLMAIFIAIISSKPVAFLERKGVPSTIAITIVVVLILLLSAVFGGVLGSSIATFTSNIDVYNQKVRVGLADLFAMLGRFGIVLDRKLLLETVKPGTIMSFTGKLLNGLGGIMGDFVMIILIVAFILGERSSYGVKIRAIVTRPEHSIHGFTQAMDQINQYLGIKTITSLATGVLVSLLLWAIGVDFPFIWGLIAFLMNFIPNIGSIIAAIPAMIMAFVTLGGLGVFYTALIYLAVNMIIGNIIEPKIMGDGLGLSTLVVILSLVFWGYLLGTTGMFLSIPLTLAAKIAFESNPTTRWIAVLLGTEEDAVELMNENINKRAEIQDNLAQKKEAH